MTKAETIKHELRDALMSIFKRDGLQSDYQHVYVRSTYQSFTHQFERQKWEWYDHRAIHINGDTVATTQTNPQRTIKITPSPYADEITGLVKTYLPYVRLETE